MVNTQLFQTLKGALLPNANTVNAEQAPAYAFTPRHRLAQLAATGCLGQTFYANAEAQLDAVLALAKELDAVFATNAGSTSMASASTASSCASAFAWKVWPRQPVAASCARR